MALEAVTPRQPGQRTLPDRTGQQGQRAAASSSSRAGCTQGPRPRLRGPWALIFTVLGVLLLVKAASAMSVRKDEIHQQSSAPLERSPQQKLCPPGEEEKNCCTLIKDTECRCKSGTFHGEDAPEFCQKYSTGCPDGKDMDMNSTLRSNIKGPSSLMIGIVTGIVITVFLIGCVVCYLKDSERPACSHRPGALCSVSEPPTCTLSLGREVWQERPPHHSVDVSSLLSLFNECWHKVIGFSSIWRPQTLGRSGALDYAHNNRLNNGD